MKNGSKWVPWIGILLVVAGLAINPLSLGRDEAKLITHSTDSVVTVVTLLIEALLVVCGLFLFFRRPRLPFARLQVVAVLALSVVACFGIYGTAQALRPPTAEDLRILESNLSETLLSAISRESKPLTKSALDLELPNETSRHLFAPQLLANDVATPDHHGDQDGHSQEPLGIATEHWPTTEVQTVDTAGWRLWPEFIDQVAFFKHAKFTFGLPAPAGREDEGLNAFEDDEHKVYRSLAKFDAVAHMETGEIAHVHAELNSLWKFDPEATSDEESFLPWRMHELTTEKFHVMRADDYLFDEVLASVVQSREDFDRVRQSTHHQMVLDYLLNPDKKPDPMFTITSGDRHPGIAVADVDGNGLDDIYVMPRWGKNSLLLNNGDGNYIEAAEQFGLDIEDHTASAIFADFDNDGDQDAFLGRTAARSLYLVNEDGRFVDRSEDWVETPLPYWVSSVSAVDYDGDGLLDVYLSTHSQSIHRSRKLRIKNMFRKGKYFEEYLSDEQARELYVRFNADDAHLHLDRPGPPNVLLRNVGDGKFALTEASRQIEIWRNSFQSTWNDFDNDGDQDVYVANDFAPNNLLENMGDGTFRDVTDETNTADIGFGMGASWGDYDNDGQEDIYVTNMYSKAGQRVTGGVGGARGETYTPAARGNSLLKKTGSRYDRVSGLQEPAMLVEMAGWGWGSQFADFDNDGYLDIYAPSGFYSAPDEIAAAADT